MNTTNPIKLLLVDDHQILIDGIRSLLDDQPQFQIIDEAHNGQEALDKLKEIQPDVVLADINMPIMSGIELTQTIQKQHPDLKVLVLTMYNDKEIITEIISAGANGYILKNTGKQEFVTAITTIAGGGSYFSNEVATTMMENIKEQNEKEKEKGNAGPPLTLAS